MATTVRNLKIFLHIALWICVKNVEPSPFAGQKVANLLSNLVKDSNQDSPVIVVFDDSQDNGHPYQHNLKKHYRDTDTYHTNRHYKTYDRDTTYNTNRNNRDTDTYHTNRNYRTYDRDTDTYPTNRHYKTYDRDTDRTNRNYKTYDRDTDHTNRHYKTYDRDTDHTNRNYKTYDKDTDHTNRHYKTYDRDTDHTNRNYKTYDRDTDHTNRHYKTYDRDTDTYHTNRDYRTYDRDTDTYHTNRNYKTYDRDTDNTNRNYRTYDRDTDTYRNNRYGNDYKTSNRGHTYYTDKTGNRYHKDTNQNTDKYNRPALVYLNRDTDTRDTRYQNRGNEEDKDVKLEKSLLRSPLLKTLVSLSKDLYLRKYDSCEEDENDSCEEVRTTARTTTEDPCEVGFNTCEEENDNPSTRGYVTDYASDRPPGMCC